VAGQKDERRKDARRFPWRLQAKPPGERNGQSPKNRRWGCHEARMLKGAGGGGRASSHSGGRSSEGRPTMSDVSVNAAPALPQTGGEVEVRKEPLLGSPSICGGPGRSPGRARYAGPYSQTGQRRCCQSLGGVPCKTSRANDGSRNPPRQETGGFKPVPSAPEEQAKRHGSNPEA